MEHEVFQHSVPLFFPSPSCLRSYGPRSEEGKIDVKIELFIEIEIKDFNTTHEYLEHQDEVGLPGLAHQLTFSHRTKSNKALVNHDNWRSNSY